jgi:nucleoid DNA-binding protein
MPEQAQEVMVVERKARKGRNPRTGQEIRIPASKAVKFRRHSARGLHKF